MKRTADRQITKDDDDGTNHQEGDSNGHRASAEVMARRRVVKVKRNADGSWKQHQQQQQQSTAAAVAAAAGGGDPSVDTNHPSQSNNPFASVRLTAEAAAAAESSSALPSSKPSTEQGLGSSFGAAAATATATSSTSEEKQETASGSSDDEDDDRKILPVGEDNHHVDRKAKHDDDVVAAAATTTTTTASLSSNASETKPFSCGSGSGKNVTSSEGPADPETNQKEAEPPAPKPKPTIFGATTGFTGFGSVGGFSGFATTTSTATAKTGGRGFFGAAPLSTPVFGGSSSTGGFAGFATAASAATSSGFFAFGKSKGDDETEAKRALEVTAVTSDSSGGGGGGDATHSAVGEEGTGSGGEAAPRPPPISSSAAAVQLPTDYELISGEESEKMLLEMRCRTYRWAPHQVVSDLAAAPALSVPPSGSSGFSSDSKLGPSAAANRAGGDSNGPGAASVDPDQQPTCKWHEAGIGPLRILWDPASDGLRLVQRRESTINGPATKVVWNVKLWKESTVARPGDKHVQISSILGNGQTVLVLCKCATVSQATDLYELLHARIPELKSARNHHDQAATLTAVAASDEREGKPEAIA